MAETKNKGLGLWWREGTDKNNKHYSFGSSQNINLNDIKTAVGDVVRINMKENDKKKDGSKQPDYVVDFDEAYKKDNGDLGNMVKETKSVGLWRNEVDDKYVYQSQNIRIDDIIENVDSISTQLSVNKVKNWESGGKIPRFSMFFGEPYDPNKKGESTDDTAENKNTPDIDASDGL